MAITYRECGVTLHHAISAAGHWLRQQDGVWITDDETAVQAIIDGFDPRPGKLAELAEYRYKIEQGGTTVGGIPILTDDRAQRLIGAAAGMARRGESDAFPFKTPAGFITATGAQVEGIYAALCLFVQACFARERDLADQINALDPATQASEINAFDVTVDWPAGS